VGALGSLVANPHQVVFAVGDLVPALRAGRVEGPRRADDPAEPGVEQDATLPLEVREGAFESRCIGGEFLRERLDVSGRFASSSTATMWFPRSDGIFPTSHSASKTIVAEQVRYAQRIP
jgi:hypothetical protein